MKVKANFWPHFFALKEAFFGNIESGPKNAYFYNHIPKFDSITLKTKFVTPNYIFKLHMTQI